MITKNNLWFKNRNYWQNDKIQFDPFLPSNDVLIIGSSVGLGLTFMFAKGMSEFSGLDQLTPRNSLSKKLTDNP